MELGICLRDESISSLVTTARFAEDHGFTEIWLPDGARGAQRDASGMLTGRDAFASLAAMFSTSTTVRGAIGVAAVPMLQPAALALAASTMSELSDGRFILGVGVSHPELTALHGVRFPDRPIEFMRGWTRQLRSMSLDGVAFGAGWPVMLAALGPQMIHIASSEADGVVLNWVSPEYASRIVDGVRASAGQRQVRTVLYVRMVDPPVGRLDAEAYSAFANYRAHFERQELTSPDAIAAATTLPLGDIGLIRERLDRYREAGVDLVCLYPIGTSVRERFDVLASVATKVD